MSDTFAVCILCKGDGLFFDEPCLLCDGVGQFPAEPDQEVAIKEAGVAHDHAAIDAKVMAVEDEVQHSTFEAQTFAFYVQGLCWLDPSTTFAFDLENERVVGKGFNKNGPFSLEGQKRDVEAMELCMVNGHTTVTMSLSWQNDRTLKGTAEDNDGTVTFTSLSRSEFLAAFQAWKKKYYSQSCAQVIHTFQSCERLSLKEGMEGRVLKVDGNGNAKIYFAEISRVATVPEEDFDKLKSGMLTPPSHSEPRFTWLISAETVQSKQAGSYIKSEFFILEGLAGFFWIKLWPQGQKTPPPEEKNKSSVFLYCSEEVKLRVRVRVNEGQGTIGKGELEKVDKDGRGWKRFHSPPTGETAIEVVLLCTGSNSPQRWNIPKHYQLGNGLGCGGYGSVCEAWDSKTQRKVAVKQMLGVFQSVFYSTRILREVGLLSELSHPNVVQIFGVYAERRLDTALYIVMELCDTDLQKVCSSSRGVSLPEARCLLYSLIVGCSYLHSVRIYHRDLKPGNCLVNRNCTVKICDFNLARIVDAPRDDEIPGPPVLQRKLTRHIGTRMYRAPEVILGLHYSHSIDVWGVGCIVAEVFRALNTDGRCPESKPLFRNRGCWPLSGRTIEDGDMQNQILDVFGTPFDEPLFQQLPERVKIQLRCYTSRAGRGIKGEVPVEATEAGVALLEQLLAFFPSQRVSMADALCHPFFSKVKKGIAEGGGEPCCLNITYDESRIHTVTDVRDQLHREIEKFGPVSDASGADSDSNA